ncbi:tripartite tricarboxylate transporter substrate binding protein [Pigmentiphaga soli]|uniref:Tripartite tricarboxylate transporter substrate binding protein n=1 Tax=Pigmentiphaga soli TaxID=1007095 RepID=A0ABP8GRV1_9BURK
MFRHFIRRWLIAAALWVAWAAPAGAADRPYPTRPVRVVVPFNAGGSTDILARALAKRLGEELGQPFVVENKLGAGGAIGAAQVARAAPDGHTLLFTTSYFALGPAIMKNVGYDPIRDFVPVSNVAFMPMVLLVRNDLPASSVSDVIRLAKQQPGALTYSSSGPGGPPHLAAALFGNLAGISLTHVPYSGAAPALLDVASSRIDISFSTLLSAVPFLKAGRMRMLAVAYKERLTGYADVPTFADAGLPALEMVTMNAMLAPAGTPRAAVDALYGAIARIVREPAMHELITEQGALTVGDSPDHFGDFLRRDVARWAELAVANNVAAGQ